MKAAIWTLVAGVWLGSFSAFGEDPASAIEVSDMETLRSKLGQKVLVKGTVREVEVQERWGHRRVWFTEGELMGFLRKGYYADGAAWKVLDDLAGKEVFIGGELVDYKGQLEILLHTNRQIKEDARDIDLKRIPLAKNLRADEDAKSNEAAPVRPGAIVPRFVPEKTVAFKSRQAEVLVARLRIADMQRDFHNAQKRVYKTTAKVLPSPGIGPAQLVVDPVQSQPSNGLLELSISLPKKLGAWPEDCLIMLSSETDEAPSNLSAAVLIEAMIAGKEIPGDVVLAGGGLNMDLEVLTSSYQLERSKPVFDSAKDRLKNGASLKLVGGKPKGGAAETYDPVRFAPGDPADAHALQILSADTLDDLLKLVSVREPAGDDLAPSLIRFAEAQRVLRDRGDDLLKNAKVMERIDEMLAALPGHLTAQYYKALATGELPPHRGRETSRAYLSRLHSRFHDETTGGKQKPEERLKAIRDELEANLVTLHPDSATVGKRLHEHCARSYKVYAKFIERADMDQRDIDNLEKHRTEAAEIHRAITQLREG